MAKEGPLWSLKISYQIQILSVSMETQPFMFASKEIPQSAIDIRAIRAASWVCLFGQVRRNLLVTIPET